LLERNYALSPLREEGGKKGSDERGEGGFLFNDLAILLRERERKR